MSYPQKRVADVFELSESLLEATDQLTGYAADLAGLGTLRQHRGSQSHAHSELASFFYSVRD